MGSRESALSVANIYTAYDQADVLEDLSLKVEEGSITCLLGSNGSGKTTLIRSILGLTPCRAGSIIFQGEEISKLPTHQIVRRGLASIPEGRKVFPGMTVEENLRLGGYGEDDPKKIEERLIKVHELFPRLKERASQLAGTMSGGEQAMVSIGRGLMGAPKLLILDEPSLGLSPLLVKENFRIIRDINRQGITVFLVEQNVREALELTDQGYILQTGRIRQGGASRELLKSDMVREAFLGM